MDAVAAVQAGDLETLRRLLRENPELATAYIDAEGVRTLLHVATDWPGHFPNGPAIVSELIACGADPNAPFRGGHTETPLHWAASSDDVAVLDVLLDHGANLEAPGAVIGGGTPLADAVAFGQWNAARRLVERGAKANLWQAAALGMLPEVESFFGQGEVSRNEATNAFWCACSGNQRRTAEFLLGHGADRHWVGHDGRTPLEAARHSDADEVVKWLESLD